MSAVDERVSRLLTPVVAASGLDLDAVEISKAGRRRLLRVIVDGAAGPSLDEVAEVSRAVSEALDASEVMGEQPYVLEVSTRGVGRPLELPRHWAHAVGRLVSVELRGADPLVGRVLTAGDDAATLEVDGASVRVPYPQVVVARVQVEFSRAPADEASDDVVDGDDGTEG